MGGVKNSWNKTKHCKKDGNVIERDGEISKQRKQMEFQVVLIKISN